MDTLHSICYVSTAVRLPSQVQLDRLLQRARERNTVADVTGLLLYRDGSFMQYIEGPRGELLKIYAIIRADPLHHRLLELVHEAVSEREFGDWAMGFSTATMPAFMALRNARWSTPPGGGIGPGRDLLRQVWNKGRP